MYQLLNSIYSSFMSALGRLIPGVLWYGVAAACGVAVVITFTRFAPAKRRYNLLMILLFGFILTLLPGFVSSTSQKTGLFIHAGHEIFGSSNYFSQAARGLQNVSGFIMANCAVAGLIWVLVSLLLLGRSVLRYAAIRRLRIISTSTPLPEWNDAVSVLSKRLGLKKSPGIFACKGIEVPVLIGHRRPVIFFPEGMAELLSVHEIEEILLHELAHVRRNDYLTNLVQVVVETTFWFNPIVWWISGLLRTERENSCDDLVVKFTGRPVDYVRSLVRFEEFRSRRYAGMMTLTGGNGGTLKRVSRIISGQNRGLGYKNFFALAILILTVAFYWVTTSYYDPGFPRQNVSSKLQSRAAARLQSDADAKHRAEAAALLKDKR